MPDTKLPIGNGARLAALKTALMAEQQVLALDTHTARERTDALLHATPHKTWPASVPSVVISKEQALG